MKIVQVTNRVHDYCEEYDSDAGVKISVIGEGVKIVSLVKGLTCVSGEGVKLVSVVKGLKIVSLVQP